MESADIISSLFGHRFTLTGSIFVLGLNIILDISRTGCYALSPLNTSIKNMNYLHRAQPSTIISHPMFLVPIPSHRKKILMYSTSQSKLSSIEINSSNKQDTEKQYQALLTKELSESQSAHTQRNLLENMYHNDFSDLENVDPILIESASTSVKTYQKARANLVTLSENDPNEKRLFGLSELWFARILLLASSALYGTNFTVVKILDEHIPIGAAAMLRFTLAAAVTSPWIFSKIDSVKEVVLDDGSNSLSGIVPDNISSVALLGMEVGMWNTIGYIAQAQGLETIDASKSAFICSLAVVVVPILDAFKGKPMTTRAFASATLAIFGVAFLELTGGSGHFGIGDIASLLQPITFGIGFWRMEHAMSKFPSEASRLTAFQLLAVAIISSIYCLLGLSGVDPPSVNDIVSWMSDPTIMSAVLWTGCVTTALTIYMETRAFKTLSASEATLVLSTEPLFGAAFAGVVVGERFGFGASVGAVLIILGCLLGSLDDDDGHPSIDEIRSEVSNQAVIESEIPTCLIENEKGECLVSDKSIPLHVALQKVKVLINSKATTLMKGIGDR